MKLNKISMVIAAMAFVGCSSDDFNLSSNKTVDESGMIQLDENFVIAGVGEEGAATRTHWEMNAAGTALVNKFLPIFDIAPAAAGRLDAMANLEAQAVGLCWLGNGAVGTDVYTNYEFYHFGWLKNGATKAEFNCGDLTNGGLYNEIDAAADPTLFAGDEMDETAFSWTATPDPGAVAKTFAINQLNYNSGVYKTENKAIFGGQYIVYYPYNEDFKDAGTIPAIAETTFDDVSEDYEDAAVGHATFRYSAPVEIKGGNQAADFGLYNLSTLVQLRVATPTTDATLAGVETIDQIVLYSPSQQLLKQANLAADKIAAGKKGAELYVSTEGTKTIVANFTAPVVLRKTDAAAPAPTPTSAYITVLPTTVEDLVVLVHSDSQQKWARVNLPNTVFEAGKAKRMDITVSAADFNSEYIAVDQASLSTALGDARAAIAADVTGTLRPTITVIGDITLDDAADINAPTYPTYVIAGVNDWKITIKGGDIIVPEDVTLNLNTNMQSNVRVLGRSCCNGVNGGILDILGGAVNNVTMVPTEAKITGAPGYTYDNLNPTVRYSANALVVAGKTIDVQAGNVVVNAAVQHKGDINIAADAKLTINAGGDLNFMGGSVVNNGTIEVMKNGKFDMTDADGNATATDGQRMTNNGKFIHNVDAGVGTAVQSMHQNGEYRCRVDDQIKLDDAFLQWTACSVIEMVNGAALSYNLGTAETIAYKHNGKYIDFEINSGALTTFSFAGGYATASTILDNKAIQIGNLTVKAGGLDIWYQKRTWVGATSSYTGLRTLTVNGNMTVNAATTITNSRKINVTKNLTVNNTKFEYAGNKANEEGLAITGNITVIGDGIALPVPPVGNPHFDASAVNALDITCANFYLKDNAWAKFGNRTEGDAHNMDVTGIIDNPAGCKFDITAAGQSAGSVLAWVTCSTLKVGGQWGAARPRVQ